MTDSLLPSMSLESRRCEQSIHDSRRLSHEFNEVVALLGNARCRLVAEMNQDPPLSMYEISSCAQEVARIDKCLAALKGQQTGA